MYYVESPEVWTRNLHNRPAIFLAGGITGCPDWQAETVKRLGEYDIVVLNPRRADFPVDDPDAAEEQISWEHMHLRRADVILFWFPFEQIQPIALYELGAWSMTLKPILLGVHPAYERKQDVEIQTSLARPDVKICYDLGATITGLDKVLQEVG